MFSYSPLHLRIFLSFFSIFLQLVFISTDLPIRLCSQHHSFFLEYLWLMSDCPSSKWGVPLNSSEFREETHASTSQRAPGQIMRESARKTETSKIIKKCDLCSYWSPSVYLLWQNKSKGGSPPAKVEDYVDTFYLLE